MSDNTIDSYLFILELNRTYQADVSWLFIYHLNVESFETKILAFGKTQTYWIFSEETEHPHFCFSERRVETEQTTSSEHSTRQTNKKRESKDEHI